MKRTLLLILALCLLLTGCGVPGEADTQSSDTSEELSTTAETTTEPIKEAALLDSCEAFDDSGALWYIPNGQIEAQQYPMLRTFAGNLLMTTTSYISDGNSEMKLTLLSATTGEALQNCTVGLTESVEPQILGDHIAVCDSQSGTVIVLDALLRETARYTLSADPGQWFLGYDLDTLYKCSYLGGKLVEPPFSGDFFRICHSDKMWLAGFYGQEDTFAFGTDANACVVTAQNGTFSLLDPVGHLLFTDFDGTLSLYDDKGVFLSSCALPGRYVQSIVWTEELGGYLLLVTDGEGCNRLLFWDIRANTNGENLQTQSLADLQAAPDGMSADASLYERAQSLSDRFGIEIRIADQCETEFTFFSCYPVSYYGPVSAGLDLLEDALSVFPEGFFRQLIYGHIDRVQFQLVGGLAATNGFGGDMSYAAFTDANGSVCKIVLDIYSLSKNTVWHELSHAIDRRLAWDATYRDEALFTEEGWSALNPDGFTYTGEYGSLGTNIQPEWYSYFIDDYSMINAAEDRARIFEYAVENSGTLFRDAPGLIAKLQYYSDCIRDCFDTALWPEITAWEAPLH